MQAGNDADSLQDEGDTKLLKDISIGQYYKTDSPVHRLDARTKLIITILYAVSLFICNNLYMYAVAGIFLIIYIALSHVPLIHIIKGMRFIWFFLVIMAIFNLFKDNGEVLFHWKFINITTVGVWGAVSVVLKLGLLVMGSSILTYTTLPMNMTDGLEKLFGFLKVFHVPVAEMAMMITIAIRFIPIITEELDKVKKAQMARGADFETGNVIKKIKCYMAVFIPLFVSAIRRAADLAEAMDARCYQGGEGRTRLRALEYHLGDVISYALTGIYFAGIIAMKILL